MRRAVRVRGAATLAAFTACAALLVGVGVEPTGCASAVPETPRDLRATSLPQRGVAAHRGASESHPENTLAAIRAAVDGGAHQIEFDVRLSADGALVLVHDRQVDRTTDGRGDVADLTLAELRALDAGAWRGAAFRGERIPTLEEGLAAVPHDRWVNLDVAERPPVHPIPPSRRRPGERNRAKVCRSFFPSRESGHAAHGT